MFHDTSVWHSVYEAVLYFFLSPPPKHFKQGVPQKKASPSLSDSSYHHCFGFLGQIFNDCVVIWITAISGPCWNYPALFLLGDEENTVPNPVHFVGVVREETCKQRGERGRKCIFWWQYQLYFFMVPVQERSPGQDRSLVCEQNVAEVDFFIFSCYFLNWWMLSGKVPSPKFF